MSQNLSVRELAEFVCRSGDLYARAEGRRIDALDGIRAQEVLRERRKNKPKLVTYDATARPHTERK